MTQFPCNISQCVCSVFNGRFLVFFRLSNEFADDQITLTKGLTSDAFRNSSIM